MKFYEVLESVMNGNKAYRKGWNGKNMFIYLENGSVVPKEKISNDTLRFSLPDDNKEVTINPHIDLKNSNGELQVGWSPSQEDLLADDWQDFYFQFNNKPMDIIHGGIVVPTSREEMYNRVLETIQDLFEQSDKLEADSDSIRLPLNTELLVKNIYFGDGRMIAITASVKEDDNYNFWSEIKEYDITVDDIVDFIYLNSNIVTLSYKEFINNPEKVLYEVIKNLTPTLKKEDNQYFMR